MIKKINFIALFFMFPFREKGKFGITDFYFENKKKKEHDKKEDLQKMKIQLSFNYSCHKCNRENEVKKKNMKKICIKHK